MDRITFLNGKTYVTHGLLTCGDYGSGAGSVGVANIRVVLKQLKGRVEDWSYSALRDESEGRASQLVRKEDYWHCEWRHQLPDSETVCLHVQGSHGSETIYLLEGDDDCHKILVELDNLWADELRRELDEADGQIALPLEVHPS